MMKRILITIDCDYRADSINLLEAADQIFSGQPYETWALVLNSHIRDLTGRFDFVLRVENEEIQGYDQKSVAALLARMHRDYSFDCIIVPATPRGRILAPRAAFKLKTGLVADVTAVSRRGDRLELIRPAYSGRIMAGISVLGDGPVMLSVRSGVFEIKKLRNVKTEIIETKGPVISVSGIRLIGRKEKTVEYEIRDSDVLISGGGGIAGSFNLLEPLARALGGRVSASRAVVDKGIVPRNLQVGQSGRIVSPRLYMALGIFGAVQHVEGLKNVENIISVNTSAKAPICSLSDIAVVGDAAAFVQKLTDRILGDRQKTEDVL